MTSFDRREDSVRDISWPITGLSYRVQRISYIQNHEDIQFQTEWIKSMEWYGIII